MKLKQAPALSRGFAAAMVALWGVASRDPAAARPFSLANLKHDTQVLSSDAFEGRGPMSAGDDRTVAYIVAAMTRAGLKPGFHGRYVQAVPMLQAETLTTTPPRLTVTGPRGAIDFAYQRDVTLNTRRNTAQIGLTGSGVVFVGYGVNAPARHWNDYAGTDVRGKTVLILINDPDWRSPPGEGPFGGAAMTYYGRWTYKYEEAARQGAAAAIIIHSDAAAGYPFSVPASSLGGARVSLADADSATNRLQVESWMTHPAAERLFALAGLDLAQLETDAARPGFKARPLGLAADVAFQVAARQGVSHNVLGRLPGARRPTEYVLYTAHWDHLGRCPPDQAGDYICNGAIDNATGVAGLLELGRAFRRAKPTGRSLLFLSTTGEEDGLLGSEYYTAHPAAPLARTVAEIDMDPLNFMLGATRDVSLIADKTELASTVRDAAAAQGRTVTPDSAPDAGNRYRSDTLSFSRAGVPVVLLGNGLDVVGRPAGWGKAALADYFDRRYHQPSDSYDPRWDWSGALQDLDLDYRIGVRLANAASWPNWFAEDEFRAARDAVRPPPRRPAVGRR
jgi:Zn-dependent M28 family amino/carboxypeptidase